LSANSYNPLRKEIENKREKKLVKLKRVLRLKTFWVQNHAVKLLVKSVIVISKIQRLIKDDSFFSL